jgi:hypothetical protein
MTTSLMKISLVTVLILSVLAPCARAGKPSQMAVLSAKISGATQVTIARLNLYLDDDKVILGGREQKDEVVALGEACFDAVGDFIREAHGSIPEDVLKSLADEAAHIRHLNSNTWVLDEEPRDNSMLIVVYQRSLGDLEKAAAVLVP